MQSTNKPTHVICAILLCTVLLISLALTIPHTHDDDHQSGCVACMIIQRMNTLTVLLAAVAVALPVLETAFHEHRITHAIKAPSRTLVSLKVRLNP